MVTARINATTLLLAVGAIVVVELLQAALQTATPLPALAATGINRLLQTALLLGIVFQVRRELAPIGLSWATLAAGIKRGLMWSSAFGIVAATGFAGYYLLGGHPLALIRSRLPDRTGDLVLLFVVGGLIAPVAEEIFFRGILYGFLRRWGAVTAVAISTVVFVILHPAPGLSLTQIVGGVVFATAYEIEGNLMVPILIHVLGNNAIFALSLTY